METEVAVKGYNIVDGTYYDATTPQTVVNILEQSRKARSDYRLIIFYGNPKTGQAWGDIVECFVGRSTGEIKIPLAVYNSRSTGGGGLLDSCIVKILSACGKKTLYKHPNYTTGKAEFYGKNAKHA